jgi:hypothetical protein
MLGQFEFATEESAVQWGVFLFGFDILRVPKRASFVLNKGETTRNIHHVLRPLVIYDRAFLWKTLPASSQGDLTPSIICAASCFLLCATLQIKTKGV